MVGAVVAIATKIIITVSRSSNVWNCRNYPFPYRSIKLIEENFIKIIASVMFRSQVNSTRAAAATGIEEADATLGIDADHLIAEAEVVVVPLELEATASTSNRRRYSSHAMIAGRSLSAQLALMGAPTKVVHQAAAAVVAATEATAIAGAAGVATTTVAGRKAAEAGATSTTQNWDHATSAWSRNCSVWATRASILTNTRIYPWRRRARMCRRTSHRSMMCS